MKKRRIGSMAEGIVGNAVKQGRGMLRSRDGARLRRGAKIFGTFFLSLLLSMVKGPMGIYPFAFGAVGAASGGVGLIAALSGSLVGSFAKGPWVSGAIRAGALVLTVLVRLFICFMKGDFREREYLIQRLFRERGYLRVTVAAAGAAAVGCTDIVRGESIYYSLFSALLLVGSTAVVTAALIFFADRGATASKRGAGLCVLTLGLCASLDAFGLPFSLGAVAAFFLGVYFSCHGGAALGCLVGFAGGLSLGGQYSAAFCAVGPVFTLLWEHSSVGAVVVSAVCASVVALFTSGLDALGDCIPEIALSAAVIAPLLSMGILPGEAIPFLDMAEPAAPSPVRDSAVDRCQRLGEAFKGLAEMLSGIGERLRLPSGRESARICASVRAKYCSGCVHEGECSGRDGDVVDSMFSNMAYRLSSKGRISARIVPETVARRCFNMDGIIESANTAVKRAASLSGKKRGEMLCSDYSAIADLLRELGEEGENERDEEGEHRLRTTLGSRGFSFSGASVFGKREKRVYLRGISPEGAELGEADLRLLCERELCARLSSPEFSIDGKYINASMHSVPAIALESGCFSIGSNKDETSGDCCAAFENENGYSYSLVSDGMGSGREAAMASGVSACYLERLLSAGCPMRSALELLNCFVRGSEGECFTTVDLMEADLYTGRARFIKSGAAPSFVIRRGRLYRIHSKTVPVGIMRALDAEAVSFDLLEGDTVIMMSDGVSGSYEESPWLYELLTEGIRGIEKPTSLARTVAEAAAENTGREDDITVCVIKVKSA